MRTKLCQINWHPSERDGGKNAPIMSTDFAPVPHYAPHPSLPSDEATTVRIVATASQDGTVRLWKLHTSSSANSFVTSSSSSSSSSPSSSSSSSSSSCASSSTTPSNASSADAFRVDYILDFEGHSMSVNAVRFSPNGECVATAGDDGYVIVWYLTTKPLDSSVIPAMSWNDVTSNRQLQRIILRGKISEICDLSWTKDSKYIITGSVDGTVGVWDVCASKICHQMKNHKGFVQGVATDPRGEYFTSQCASRTCRIHKVDMTKKMARSMFKACSTLRSRQVNWDPLTSSKNSKKANTTTVVPPATNGIAPNDVATKDTESTRSFNSHALYLDNISTTTFFRRPTWTIDGSLLITPTGQFKADPCEKYQNTTYLFARNQWESPVAHFPIGEAMPTVGARCNPILFELRKDATTHEACPKPLIKLPYRMIVAVLSTNAIMIYDTQHTHMLSIIRNQHCANLTDIAWSNDGLTLFVTSSDGFCSVVEFSDDELGVPCQRSSYPETMMNMTFQPWFAVRARDEKLKAQERALDKQNVVSGEKRTAAAADGAVVTVDSSSASDATKKSKKRRVSLVAVSPSEASAGNLIDAP